MDGRRRLPAIHQHQQRGALMDREIQDLLLENQRLGATHVALKHEISASEQEVRRLSAAALKVKAERDAQVRDIYERSLKMEELNQVRSDTLKLNAVRMELSSELQAVNSDLARVTAELQQYPTIKAEIESLRHDIQRGRAAVDYEKKLQAENLEHEQAMEKNIVGMARELEKLRAELANAEKRARAAAAAAAVANPEPNHQPEISVFVDEHPPWFLPHYK
ncbi:hypothetical protein ACHQM5_007768 [Ranunculus cassubicifolius]